MKQLLLTLLIAFSSSILLGNQINDGPSKNTIIIIKDNVQVPNSSSKPRTLVECDIEAYYFAKAVTLIFNIDLGDCDIRITNLTTGEVWCDHVSGAGITSTTISHDAGYYTIEIETDYGHYYGEFTL